MSLDGKENGHQDLLSSCMSRDELKYWLNLDCDYLNLHNWLFSVTTKGIETEHVGSNPVQKEKYNKNGC